MEEVIPNAAIKAVAKRLKHYIDVERREEGFDTSGPLKPRGHHHVGRGLGGTFHYNSLQDKHMQHYYQQPHLRKYLTEMGIVQPEMFGSKSKSRHRCSKSDRKRSSKPLKKECTWLTETSAQLLIEKVKSKSLDDGSVVEQITSNHSDPIRSGYTCTTPRRQCRSSGRSSQDNRNNDEYNIQLEESSSKPILSSSHLHNEVFEQNYDCLDGQDELQKSGKVAHHEPKMTPVHQGSTSTQNTVGSLALSSFSPQPLDQLQVTSFTHSSLAIQTGIGVVNVKTTSAPMMQESVSVSTTSSRDASTQTLVHTETQTEQSTLFNLSMRQQKRTKRQLRKKSKSTQSVPNIINDVMATCSQTIDTNIGSVMTPVENSHSQNEILDGSKPGDKTITMTEIIESRRHTYIHDLVAGGDVTQMKELLTDNPSLVNSLNGQGHTPLHIACTTGKSNAIEVLGLFGTDLLTQTPTGYAAMHIAAMCGNTNCLKVLVSMKCDVNCQTVDNQTPLHVAAMSGELECCRWLVANNANLSAEDSSGRTPYDIAKEHDHFDVCCYLLNKAGSTSQTDTSLDFGITLPSLKGGPQDNAESGLLESDVDDNRENSSTPGKELSGAKSASKSSMLANINATNDSQISSPIHDSSVLDSDVEPAAKVDHEAMLIPDTLFSVTNLDASPKANQPTDSDVVINTELAESDYQGRPVLSCSLEIDDNCSYASNNGKEILRYPSPVHPHSDDIHDCEESCRGGQELPEDLAHRATPNRQLKTVEDIN